MSRPKMMGKPRTVRFPPEVDRRVSAMAARKGKSVSDVIRESIVHELEEVGQTAGEWILLVAKRPTPKRHLDAAFIRSYEARHA